MIRLLPNAFGRASLVLGMLIAFLIAFASMASALDGVDHAEGERHTHSGLTLATPIVDDHHDAGIEHSDADDPSDPGTPKSGQAHHHHLDPSAGLVFGLAVVMPTERGQDQRPPSVESSLADVQVEGLQRPPRTGVATA